ncbi:MAG: hypothetical protein R2856_35005 [Caldilineaceae bacterium]
MHLIHSHYHNGSERNLVHAVRCAAAELGPSAIGVICEERSRADGGGAPWQQPAASSSATVTVETFLASDIHVAALPRRMQFLENRQMAILRRSQVEIYDLDGNVCYLPVNGISWDADAAEKGEYARFMQKEIFEQAESIQRTWPTASTSPTTASALPELNLACRPSACAS